MAHDLLRLEDLTKYYTSAGGVGLGLHKVNLSFNLGEFVVITGSSGSGKTTLLNVITGMDTYEEGSIFVDGEDTTYFGASDYEKFRREYVSFIFQNYNLVDSFTAYQNVELALIARGIPASERKQQVIEMLTKVGLSKRIYHRVTKLSGGEKQRVSIARALCSDAPIIACDEITGNLDMATSMEIIELLKSLSKDKLVLLVSHDVNEAIDYATRVVVMHDGSVDKDYFVNQEKKEETNIETKKRTLNKVSFKDTVRLAVRTLMSTPSKFIFLLLITLFFTLFLFAGTATYLYMEDVNITILEEDSKADNTGYTNRIIVRRTDDEPMSLEEINKFHELKKTSAIIKDDILFDSKIYYAFDDEVSTDLYETIILPSSILSFNDLFRGRVPKSANEVVVVGESKFLNKTIYIALDGFDEPIECKVVGVMPKTEESALYLHDDILPEIIKRREMNSVPVYWPEGREPNNNDLKQLYGIGYDWYIDDTLADNEFRIEKHTRKYTSSSMYQSSMDFEQVHFIFTSNNTELPFFYINVHVDTYLYEFNEPIYKSGLDRLKDICDKKSIDNDNNSSINAYVNKANYEKIMAFNMQNFQISVLANDEKDLRSIATEIEKGDYYCTSKGLIVNQSQVLLSTVLKVVVIVAVIAISLGLALIVYAIMKNILNSQQKTFLIMRSLGIDGNKITIQIYIELAFTLVVNFIIAFILWCTFKIRNFGGFFTSINEANFATILLIYAFSIAVFTILGFKYSSSVIASSIVNKEME